MADSEQARRVPDAAQRQRVGSDLRFSIVRALREADIVIPFPQRDLYVKEWPRATNGADDASMVL